MKRIHHLNCGSLCPLGGKFIDGMSDGLHAQLVCHCLLLEGRTSLILVDTGIGVQDIRDPSRISAFFRGTLRPTLSIEETAIDQIRRLGFSPRDVGQIIVTHLDFDHAGGIADFPNAKVHVMATEREAAFARKGILGRWRYRPVQFDDANFITHHVIEGERWFGFNSVRYLEGIEEDVRMIPLPGHTPGHCGVAVQDNDGRWLLHAGDAYFYREEMNIANPRCTPGLTAIQKLMEADRGLRLENQRRLRDLILKHSDQVDVISAHDALEFDRYSLRDAEAMITPGLLSGHRREFPRHPSSAKN